MPRIALADVSFSLPTVSLVALMAATRFHGDFQTLPDASLAVFFLAGMLVESPWVFAILLLAAGLIDWLAIAYGGVSSWCVTPAYLCLIPTYGVVWLGGRLSRRQAPDTGGVAAIFVILTAATLIAFLISNASFYALSGYFDALDFKTYAVRVLPYLGSYLLAPLAYTALVLAARRILRPLGAVLPHRAA